MRKIHKKRIFTFVWLRRKFVLGFVGTYLFLGMITAQSINYEHISSESGLSQNMVYCLFQDQKGFIWIGTKDGLNRYDGYRFVTYRYDPFDSLSISNNSVRQILEDHLGRMWVVTEGGIHLFDRELEAFYRLNAPSSVDEIREDAQHNLWQGGHQRGILHIVLPPDEKTLKSVKTTWVTTDDKVQRLFTTPVWLNNGGGLVAEQGVGCYNLCYNQKQQRYQLDRDFSKEHNAEFRQYIENLDSIKNRMLNWFLPGLNGKVWSASADFLCSWDANKRVFNKVAIPKDYANYKYLGLFWNEISHLLEDHKGRVWVGGFNSDFQVNVKAKEVRSLTPDQTAVNHPLYSGTASSLEDRSGVVWLGTRGRGLVKYDDKAQRFAKGLWKGQSIRRIYQTSDGWLWLATNVHYIYARNPRTGKLEQMAKGNLFNDASLGYVNCFHEDKNHTLWVGTLVWGLLKITNWQSGNPRYEAIIEDKGVQWNLLNEPKQILEDAAGVFWIISSSELRRFDPVTYQVKRYPLFKGDQVRALKNVYPCLFQDQKGRLWVGTASEGLWLFNQDKGTFIKYQNDRKNPSSLSNDAIKCIAADPQQPDRFLWIGTGGGGLNRFDTKTGVFERFMEKDGLPDLTVYGILFDKIGNLWLSSNKGLSVFNPKTRSFRNFKQNDGLQDLEFNTYAAYKAPDGQMFFGGIGGYNAFYPEQMLSANSHAPKVVFTDFKIANRSVSHKTSDSPLKTAVAYAQQIVLQPDVKVFSFEFAALDYSAPADNQFMCKLEGFDPDWQYLDNVHTITYTNLSPGKYTLRVRGSNNDGVWSARDAVIKLIVRAPWWARWWAWILYLLTVTSIVFAFWQQQKNRIKANNEAQRHKDLSDAKTHFFANVSHELRTPLTLLTGSLSTLLKGNTLTEKQTRLLNIANRGGKQLEQLVNEILDLRKLEQGQMVLQVKSTNLSAFVGAYAAQFESLAERKEIDFVLHLPSEEPILLDQEKVRQMLFNLLGNAFKFTPKGGWVELSVSLEADHLLLRVADNGPGIHPDDLPHVFDQYFQTKRPDKAAEGGTGIGLALCREYAHLFGGNISVESTLGRGSIFSVSFPVKPGAETALSPTLDKVEAQEIVPLPLSSDASRADKPTLLIVEDNPDLQDYIQTILQEKYQIVTADNGQTAWDKLMADRIQRPTLILSDLMMPVMDGYQLLEKLKSEDTTRHIPVIMLTARAEVEDKLKALRIGVDDYLIKPFVEEELLVRIENLLKNSAARTVTPANEVSLPETAVPLISQHDREWLEALEHYVKKRISSDLLSVGALAHEFAMSESTLLRQLKRLTGLSPVQYLQEIRLNEARRLLESGGEESVARIAFKVGYSEPRSFSRVFKQRFGKSPSEYMNA